MQINSLQSVPFDNGKMSFSHTNKTNKSQSKSRLYPPPSHPVHQFLHKGEGHLLEGGKIPPDDPYSSLHALIPQTPTHQYEFLHVGEGHSVKGGRISPDDPYRSLHILIPQSPTHQVQFLHSGAGHSVKGGKIPPGDPNYTSLPHKDTFRIGSRRQISSIRQQSSLDSRSDSSSSSSRSDSPSTLPVPLAVRVPVPVPIAVPVKVFVNEIDSLSVVPLPNTIQSLGETANSAVQLVMGSHPDRVEDSIAEVGSVDSTPLVLSQAVVVPQHSQSTVKLVMNEMDHSDQKVVSASSSCFECSENDSNSQLCSRSFCVML